MNFDLVHHLLGMTLFGSEWVLWILVTLSITSISIILERSVFFWKLRLNYNQFVNEFTEALKHKDLKKAEALCDQHPLTVEAFVLKKGLEHFHQDRVVVEGVMEGAAIGQKQRLEKGLVILGTLGNNAPFIGLFGTVIGVIVAFHSLANNPEGGPSVVMSGISEALIATAVGLIVAIPAVIAFNGFTRHVKTKMNQTQALMKLVTTFQKH